MNFEFSEEQDMLREQAQGFLSDHCPPSTVRKILDGEESFDAELWQKVVEMGWTATVIPEEYEGLGLSYLELSVIAEELGRALAPLPFSSSVYLATEAVLLAGSDNQKQALLPKLAGGSVIGCLAVAEAAGQASPASMNASLSGSTLNGTKIPVADGDIADFAVVIAGSNQGDGATACLVDLTQSGVTREKVSTIEPSRSHARLTFNDASAEVLGNEGDGWWLADRTGDGKGVCPGSIRVWPAHRELPGYQAQARQYLCQEYPGEIELLLRRLGLVD
jgi:alkylation response protein AidB-like acyl-CoA dehydrogenase